MNKPAISSVLQLIAVGVIAYAWLINSDVTMHLVLIAIALILYLISLAVDPKFRARMNEISRAPVRFRKPPESKQGEP
jgi:O-antigen/teichoic acid export membrane protein